MQVTVKDCKTLLLPDKTIGTGIVTPRCSGDDQQTMRLVDKQGGVIGEVGSWRSCRSSVRSCVSWLMWDLSAASSSRAQLL